ncbi:MAG: type III polyketide synthase [Planctomycetota bacterium]|jgi:predicted naringenin-chalcone synthase
MSVYIQNIASEAPETCYSQSFVREKMKGWLKGSRRLNRYIDTIYNHSRIDKRHSVIADTDAFFETSDTDKVSGPSTKARNDMFTAAAKKMCVDVARKAILECANADFSDITHLVTVSCTGFFNPGPDYEIIKALNLSKSVQRYNIGFMGCYAAFPALRLAHAICRSDPGATVLIVAIELCTLHAQLKEDSDSLRSGALFADGAAAVVVSAKEPAPNSGVLELDHFESTLMPDSEHDMAWTIGDTGFEMVLSQYIPAIIESNIRAIVEPLLTCRRMDISDVDHWAVHPGGRAVLDKIESSLGLEHRLEDSRTVLGQYGNMSSATVLFVLKRILERPGVKPRESVVSMAFGPGLTAELGFLTKITTPVPVPYVAKTAPAPSLSHSHDAFERVQP